MPWHNANLPDVCNEICKKLIYFFSQTFPYVGLVLLGHTANSLNKHYEKWDWRCYLVSCLSAITLGVVIYFMAESLGVKTQWGYVFAVLAGHNSKEALDLFSKDLLEWIYKKVKR